MIRRVFNFLTALSLLLCVATLALWVRSYGRQDYFHRSWIGADGVTVGSEAVHSSAGRLWVDWNSSTISPSEVARIRSEWRVLESQGDGQDQWAYASHLPEPPDVPWERMRFHSFGRKVGGPRNTQAEYGSAGVPHAAVAALAAVLPAIQLPLKLRDIRRRRRRRTRGMCVGCGYDLTGNVSGVCPECGTAKQ